MYVIRPDLPGLWSTELAGCGIRILVEPILV